MSKTISLIQRVQIASPCTASWDEMAGDDKSRFCSHCKLNVYNLSAMTQNEAEQLIIAKEGKLCARIYRRRDGTILTRDCPVGLAAIRHHALKYTVKVAAALFAIFGATAAAIMGNPRDLTDEQYWLVTGTRTTAFTRTIDNIDNWLTAKLPQRGWIGGAMMVVPPSNVQPQTPGNSCDAQANPDRQAK